MKSHALVYYSDDKPGITRHKWGRGFIYKDHEGVKIRDEVVIKRIKDLVIPPIWTKVWICPDSYGHLQSTGYDLKKRKQYIYHPIWMEISRQKKFDRIYEFGKKLPEIRKRIEDDLSKKEWTKNKVVALAMHILDEHYLRVGNKYYTNKNETYGLTTLRRKHIAATSNGIKLNFTAKSNKERDIEIEDPQLADWIKEMSELPGYEVFRYKEGYSNWQSIDSHDINEHLRTITGKDFTAKDFRTWGGTKLAVELYPEAKDKVAENDRLSLEPTLIKLVAEQLGNTPATCKEYYVHPSVLNALCEDAIPEEEYNKEGLDNSEQVVMQILNMRY